MSVLYGGNVGEIDAGKGIVAFCPLLLPPCPGDDLAVKNNVYIMGALTACKEQAVREIGLCVGDLQVDGLLGAGDDDGLFRVLNQVGEGRGGVRHGICAVADHEAIVRVIMLLYGFSDEKPVLRLHIGAVDVQDLNGICVAEAGHIRDIA